MGLAPLGPSGNSSESKDGAGPARGRRAVRVSYRRVRRCAHRASGDEVGRRSSPRDRDGTGVGDCVLFERADEELPTDQSWPRAFRISAGFLSPSADQRHRTLLPWRMGRSQSARRAGIAFVPGQLRTRAFLRDFEGARRGSDERQDCSRRGDRDCSSAGDRAGFVRGSGCGS